MEAPLLEPPQRDRPEHRFGRRQGAGRGRARTGIRTAVPAQIGRRAAAGAVDRHAYRFRRGGPQRRLPAPGRPPETGRHGGHRAVRSRPFCRRSAPPLRHQGNRWGVHPRRAHAAAPGGRCAAGHPGADGRGTVFAADRLRQCGQPAAGARGGARARDGVARGAGRRALGPGAPHTGGSFSTLAGAGAVLGLGLAGLGINLLVYLAPKNLPRLDEVAIDPVVLAFTALAALLAASVFGIIPALRASRPDIMDVLRASGRATGLGSGHLLRNAVVMTEVALSFVLLIGGGLMARSFLAITHADPGFQADGVLTFLAPVDRTSTRL